MKKYWCYRLMGLFILVKYGCCYGNKQMEKCKVMPLPYSLLTWLAYYDVHSALFLALLYPHTYFCFAIPISVDVKFLYLAFLVSCLKILIFLPPPHLKENVTPKETSGRGEISSYLCQQLLRNFSP